MPLSIANALLRVVNGALARGIEAHTRDSLRIINQRAEPKLHLSFYSLVSLPGVLTSGVDSPSMTKLI